MTWVPRQPADSGGYEDLAAIADVVDLSAHQMAVASLADVVRSRAPPVGLRTSPSCGGACRPLAGASLDELRSILLQGLRRRQVGEAD